MKKSLLLFLVIGLTFFRLGATIPVLPISDSLSEEHKLITREAFQAFKSLPKQERKERLKKARKEIRNYYTSKKSGKETDVNLLILVVLAILLPPVAVYLYEQETNTKFWITLLLFLLGIAGAVFFSWLLIFAAVVFALLVVLGAA